MGWLRCGERVAKKRLSPTLIKGYTFAEGLVELHVQPLTVLSEILCLKYAVIW